MSICVVSFTDCIFQDKYFKIYFSYTIRDFKKRMFMYWEEWNRHTVFFSPFLLLLVFWKSFSRKQAAWPFSSSLWSHPEHFSLGTCPSCTPSRAALHCNAALQPEQARSVLVWACLPLLKLSVKMGQIASQGANNFQILRILISLFWGLPFLICLS